jgi:hypothetical protein
MVGRLLQVDKNKIIIKLKCTLRDQCELPVKGITQNKR